jgi:conjugative transfer signal peptidase TraF
MPEAAIKSLNDRNAGNPAVRQANPFLKEPIMTTRPGQSALLKAATAAAIVIATTYVGFQAGGVRVNASSSLPIGLYIKTSARRANLVEFCPPEPFASFSKGRGYRMSGNCPDAAEPLMKPVVAAEGDVVEVSASGVAVNGRLLPNSSPRLVDTENRALRHWPFGKYRVAAGTVWVVSSFNQRSFDSRYFGPIPNICIRSRLLPLITE